jgi:ferredoxin
VFGRNRKKGKALIYISDCIGCGDCITGCHRKAIEFICSNGEKYARMIYPERCCGCGKCINICENDAIRIIETNNV